MYSRSIQGIFILLLVCSTGFQGQLDVLQYVAWATMMAEYTQEHGLSKGIQQTFNGEAPCDLCHTVTERRNTLPLEGLDSPPLPEKHIGFLETVPVFYHAMPCVIARWFCTFDLRNPDLLPPEDPPPRRV